MLYLRWYILYIVVIKNNVGLLFYSSFELVNAMENDISSEKLILYKWK